MGLVPRSLPRRLPYGARRDLVAGRQGHRLVRQAARRHREGRAGLGVPQRRREPRAREPRRRRRRSRARLDEVALTARETLLERLDEIARSLEGRGDAIALLGLGSVGRELNRIDAYSDLDFFAVVDDDAKPRYLADISWLEEAAPVVFEFENTVDGRKVLFADGVYAEYAIFTLAELRRAAFAPGRVVWSRGDAPSDLESLGALPQPSPLHTPAFQLAEALTNVFVGLQRDARGERLSGMRLIQVHAVDRLLTYLELTGEAAAGDPFAPERRAEVRAPAFDLAPLTRGYDGNRASALAILEWIEQRAPVNAALAARIRELAASL